VSKHNLNPAHGHIDRLSTLGLALYNSRPYATGELSYMSKDIKQKQGVAIDEALNLLNEADTQSLLEQHEAQLAALPADAADAQRHALLLDIASDYLALNRHQDAWDGARACLEYFLQDQNWQLAVEACDVLYQCEQEDSILALAHGIWLAVTFPIEPATSIGMLQHFIDETPADSDGAAVAAVSAHYIANLRAEGEQAKSLAFLTTQLIAQVAERHSQVQTQDMLEFWMEKLELTEPGVFLPKLAKVLDIIVDDKWWFDRDHLRRMIPDN